MLRLLPLRLLPHPQHIPQLTPSRQLIQAGRRPKAEGTAGCGGHPLQQQCRHLLCGAVSGAAGGSGTGQSSALCLAVLGCGAGSRRVSGAGHVAEAEDGKPEKPHPQEPAGRAGPDGDLRGCGAGTGPGAASHRRGTVREPSGHRRGVRAGEPGAACRPAAAGSLEEPGRPLGDRGVYFVCEHAYADGPVRYADHPCVEPLLRRHSIEAEAAG